MVVATARQKEVNMDNKKMTKDEFNEIIKDILPLTSFAKNDYEGMLNTLSLFLIYSANTNEEVYKKDNTQEWAKNISEREYKEAKKIYNILDNRGYYTK